MIGCTAHWTGMDKSVR